MGLLSGKPLKERRSGEVDWYDSELGGANRDGAGDKLMAIAGAVNRSAHYRFLLH
jgi:hypothetical protein